MRKIKYFLILILIAVIITTFFLLENNVRENVDWEISDINFKARDGFLLHAYILKPMNPDKKFPAVAALHQLWGNRDDFLKLFPDFAKMGIIVIAPDFPRQRPNLNFNRVSDLRDTVNYLEKLKYVDRTKIGIITSSFSVDTGLMAVKGEKNVLADVMLSGPVISEDSKKWITRNQDLAIFTITSIFDEKPGQPAHHHLIMKELLKRSLNLKSKGKFISDRKNPFSIYAHGTFVFDEKPETILEITSFFSDVFGIKDPANGILKQSIPFHGVEFKSLDNFPVVGTFKVPGLINRKIPAVILYPPQFQNRRYYNRMINSFVSRGIAVLAPNTKRTCRREGTLNLCKDEVGGAVDFLRNKSFIDMNRVGILIPSFYYLFAKKMFKEEMFPFKVVVFMETGEMNYKLDPKTFNSKKYKTAFLTRKDFEKILYFFRKEL